MSERRLTNLRASVRHFIHCSGVCRKKKVNSSAHTQSRVSDNQIALRPARTICLAMSVEATMSLNSSKLNLPSPSWSASIIAGGGGEAGGGRAKV